VIRSSLESTKIINDILIKNNVAFIVIVGGYQAKFHAAKVISEFNNTLYRPPNYLVQEVRERIQNLKELSKAKGFKYFNDYLARLDGFRAKPDNVLLLRFSRTDYFTFSALHKGLDRPIMIQKQPSSLSLSLSSRSTLNENLIDFEHSRLPNPLAVVVSLILQPERKIVLVKRSKQNFESTGLLSTPIGGSISLGSGDINSNNFSPDPIKTVIRETQEEIGLKVKESQITFFWSWKRS
jgi:NUDIX domain